MATMGHSTMDFSDHQSTWAFEMFHCKIMVRSIRPKNLCELWTYVGVKPEEYEMYEPERCQTNICLFGVKLVKPGETCWSWWYLMYIYFLSTFPIYIYLLNLATPENSASLHVPRYQRLFRTKLDHQGRPVRYDIFRRRSLPGGVWVEQGMVMYGNVALPETNNSPIRHRSISYISSSSHPFSGAKMLVSGSVNSVNDIVIGLP